MRYRAGVPVASSAVTGSLASQPAAQALLTVLAATADGLDADQALTLLTGPIGRVDPVSLRQLRRTLRRADIDGSPTEFADLLVEAVNGASLARLTGAQARSLGRVRAVLAAAAESHRGVGALPREREVPPPACGGDPRYTLWAAWHRSGLQRRWLAACERGGPSRRPGRSGPRHGDGVVRRDRPIPVAHRRCRRCAGLSIIWSRSPCPPSAPPSPTIAAEQVSRCSTRTPRSATKWDLVVIAGLQEGLWPNTIPRGGVLATQRLLDGRARWGCRERLDAGTAARRGTATRGGRDGTERAQAACR